MPSLLEWFFGRQWQGQRQYGNAFVEQVGRFLRRGLAAYAARLRFAMVHAPRQRRKLRTDVFGIRDNLARQGQPCGLKRLRGCICCKAGGLRALAIASIRKSGPQIQARSTQPLAHLGATAHRALDQAARELVVEILFTRKPALECVIQGAQKIKNLQCKNPVNPARR